MGVSRQEYWSGLPFSSPSPIPYYWKVVFFGGGELVAIIKDAYMNDLAHTSLQRIYFSSMKSKEQNFWVKRLKKKMFGAWASLVAKIVKSLPAVQETRVWSLGQEDPLEKEVATHSSILDWKIWWTEEPGRLQSMGSQRGGHDQVISLWCLWYLHHQWVLQKLDTNWYFPPKEPISLHSYTNTCLHC